MEKDFMHDGDKSNLKQEEPTVFVDQQITIDGVEKETLQQDPLDAIADELNKTKEQLLRVGADFTNFKKRVEKERADWQTNAYINAIKPFLNLIDDFERALATQQPETATSSAWLEGFSMIHKNVLKQLESMGVKEIETNNDFNPLFHEALLLVTAENHTSGQIVQVLRKGYTYHNVVIRCAQVSVAQ
jgi:molecular chaperone GrpE